MRQWVERQFLGGSRCRGIEREPAPEGPFESFAGGQIDCPRVVDHVALEPRKALRAERDQVVPGPVMGEQCLEERAEPFADGFRVGFVAGWFVGNNVREQGMLESLVENCGGPGSVRVLLGGGDDSVADLSSGLTDQRLTGLDLILAKVATDDANGSAQITRTEDGLLGIAPGALVDGQVDGEVKSFGFAANFGDQVFERLGVHERSQVGFMAGGAKAFDQGLELIKLVLARDERGFSGMHDHQIIDADRGDEPAIVGDQD